MKTIRDFLRKHALLLLAALVVVSVPVGAALGKYAASETVTDKLNLNVSMKTYTLKNNVWQTIYQSMKSAGKDWSPDTIVLDYNVPDGAERIQISGKDIDLCDNKADPKTGSIYAYYSDTENTIYVAPEQPGKMIASNCHYMFSSYFTNIGQPYRDMLKHIVINNLDTSKATKMEEMFSYNYALTSIEFGSGFITGGVKTMKNMFYGCKSITSLDLRFFNTSTVTDMSYMFGSCEKLTSLNISTFDTSKVTNMETMFGSCKSITVLDLSNFDTSNLTNTYGMFCWDNKLQTVYVSDMFTIDNITNGSSMFVGCSSIKGSNGTTFDSSKIDHSYARIDGGPNSATPGYFTDKNATQSLTYSATGTDEAANGFGLALDLAS